MNAFQTLIGKCRSLTRRLTTCGTSFFKSETIVARGQQSIFLYQYCCAGMMLHKQVNIQKKSDQMITSLRRELEQAWIVAETYRAKEKAADELIGYQGIALPPCPFTTCLYPRCRHFLWVFFYCTTCHPHSLIHQPDTFVHLSTR